MYRSSVHVVSTEKLFSPACKTPLMRVHLRVGKGQSRLVRGCVVCVAGWDGWMGWWVWRVVCVVCVVSGV